MARGLYPVGRPAAWRDNRACRTGGGSHDRTPPVLITTVRPGLRRRVPDGRGVAARPAGRHPLARRAAAPQGPRARTAVDRRRRAEGDDADARRRAPGDRHLPAEERHRPGARRVLEDAVQLQLLGRPQPRARRHVDGADGGEEGLRLRRAERARPLLLGGQLRHPRRADHRWLRRHRLAGPAIVVQRQGRHDGLFIDRGVAAGGGLARSSRVCGHERAGVRRRRRTRGPVRRAGQLVPRRRGADAVHRLALRRAEPDSSAVPDGDEPRGSRGRLAAVRPGAADAAGGLGQDAVDAADGRTS